MGCFLFFFPFLRFLKTVMRVALPPLFLLISSKVINVVYSAEWCAFPLFDCGKQFCHAACLCIFIFCFPTWVGYINECFSANLHIQPAPSHQDFNLHHGTLHFLPLYFPNPPCPPHSQILVSAQPTIHTYTVTISFDHF